MKRLILLILTVLLCCGYQTLNAQEKKIKELLEKKYSSVVYQSGSGGWFDVKLNDKEGACDLTGKEIIPCKYDNVDFYGNSYGIKLKGKEGSCDLTGTEIIPCKYDEVTFYGDRYGIKLNGKEGTCDLTGKEVISCKYDNILLSGGYYHIKLDGKEGTCDLTGKEVIPCIYDYILLSGGYYHIKLNGKEGACDLTGKEVIPCNYNAVNYSEKSGLYSVNVDGFENKETNSVDGGKWGLIDKLGKEIIPCKYANDLAYYFDNSEYAPVNFGGISINYKISGGKWGLINRHGDEIVPCLYDDISVVSDGLVAVNKGGNYKDGKCEGGKWGYVDLKGNMIIEPQYDTAEGFKEGAAMVSKEGQTMLIENPLKKGSANISANLLNTTINSDVDVNIPVEKTDNNSEAFVFIVANENYPQAKVPFALNDGRVFKAYCQKTLGIPEQNIKIYEDATYGNLVSAVNKIKEIADVFDGEARIIFYYAGHGVPDEKDNTAYLLPVDGLSNNSSITGYSLIKLNQELGNLRAKSVTVLLDACFSGAKREGDMLASSRGVSIKVNAAHPVGNMIVFSASSGDETAHQYKEKGHGLFTYYLLKKLQETKGGLTYQELSDYVIREVKRQSVVINSKRQTPTLTISDTMNKSWSNLKVK